MDRLHPGVSIEEDPSQLHIIAGEGTSRTAFVGICLKGPVNQAVLINSWLEFEQKLGALSMHSPMSFSIRDYFTNGGKEAVVVRIQNMDDTTPPNIGISLHSLDAIDSFNMLCIPPLSFDTDIEPAVWRDAANYCEQRRAILLMDPPSTWQSAAHVSADLRLAFLPTSSNVALYFPRLQQRNPLAADQLESFVPCGAVAGIIARTDEQRGVWKAPAGRDAVIRGTDGLTLLLSSEDNAQLNELGVNCLRSLPGIGHVLWGIRTRQNAGQGRNWRYLPVCRTALFIEESLSKGLQWVVFEPNSERLWDQIRHSTEQFLQRLFQQGAFQGNRPSEAFYVRCDRTTTTQADIDNGKIVLQIGIAMLKPQEFESLILVLQGNSS